MHIYHYDGKTKEYIGQSSAKENPFEPGRYLIPDNATTEMPMIANLNEIQIFENNAWALKSDYRGTIYYEKETGKKHTIETIGEIVFESFILIAPTEGLIKPKWNDETSMWIESQ